MGASSSRMAPPRGSGGDGERRSRFRMGSLLCGTSFPDDDAPHQDDADSLQHLIKDSCPKHCEEGECSRPNQHTVSCQSSYSTNGMTVNCASSSAESSNSKKRTTECEKLCPHEANTGRLNEICCTIKSPSLESSPVPQNISSESVEVLADSTNVFGSEILLDPSSNAQQQHNDFPSDGTFASNENGETSDSYSEPNSFLNLSDSSTIRQSLRDEPSNSSTLQQSMMDEPNEEAAFSASGSPPAVGLRERRSGNVLHVDVLSISSEILPSNTEDISSRETRRNSRRLFWDAFSRRSSRRSGDTPSVFFSNEDADDLGTHDRWLLDFSSDSFGSEFGDSLGSLRSRRRGVVANRLHSRSEVWERLNGSLGEGSRNTNRCASGLHQDGTCSCEALLIAEGLSTRASISRIVVLAEALFEVLDEIHRQPVPLSLSVPAPESVVNSFPLKTHKKSDLAGSGEDDEQCYICLAEYEDGDKIRVLPCKHEYHMPCVDKWLKEIHGICPLCRGDVSLGVNEIPVSNTL